MELKIIETGYFRGDGGAAFGLLPRKIWNRHYPADGDHYCLMAMRCAVLITERKRILLDTGPGTKQPNRLKGYRMERLATPDSVLKTWGIEAEEITDVILSHLHFDHCGHATRFDEKSGKTVPTFPRARYHVGKSQWERSLAPGPADYDAYFTENMEAVEKAGLLHLRESEYEVDDGVYIRSYDGHTPGQLVTVFNCGKEEYVFAGDTVPLALNATVRSVSAFDLHAEESMRTKTEILGEAADRNRILIFSHDAYTPAARIKRVNDSFKVSEAVRL